MSDKQVIDLTESFTLADHSALSNIIIELDDSAVSPSTSDETVSTNSVASAAPNQHSRPRVPQASYRRRQLPPPGVRWLGQLRDLDEPGHVLRQLDPDSSIEIIDYALPYDTSIICLSARRKKKVNQPLQSVINETTEEHARERSPRNEIGYCPICFERIGVNPLSATKCGHVFCQHCLVQALHIDKKCPTCRQALRGKLAYHPLYLNRK